MIHEAIFVGARDLLCNEHSIPLTTYKQACDDDDNVKKTFRIVQKLEMELGREKRMDRRWYGKRIGIV